ncbi:hypothetical protein P153DRAFT_401466 [Dothidotthia symphoricarpi CBS 119687]|uniref:Uncharacterized protein n=1 Tax=Dothidotthia symphoricarpi CBS 119687 TaxID=1392245 RepID=A0A6A5ZX78_9PLEO|nr:uncharacterized protein P153DRAFT_401466 [Dothidotthia symphoricarpi CBS 119687]KAF2123906.1 hypothetical protein P153DRAFT_401466 [Dothidotthia symphoricarpi CBS 119687]
MDPKPTRSVILWFPQSNKYARAAQNTLYNAIFNPRYQYHRYLPQQHGSEFNVLPKELVRRYASFQPRVSPTPPERERTREITPIPLRVLPNTPPVLAQSTSFHRAGSSTWAFPRNGLYTGPPTGVYTGFAPRHGWSLSGEPEKDVLSHVQWYGWERERQARIRADKSARITDRQARWANDRVE